MAEQIAFNIDCMEYMKTLPDNAFDLAVVDPPYGDATENQPERERETRSITDSEGGSIDTRVARTGGAWAKKYGKKS